MPPPNHRHLDRTVCYEILFHLPKRQAQKIMAKYGEEKLFTQAFAQAYERQADLSTCFTEAVIEAAREAFQEIGYVK